MVKIVSSNDSENSALLATQELRDGKCVAIPTETVYGLAADATNGIAVAKIFEMKNRPSFNPLICHVDSIEMAKAYGTFNALCEKLAGKFWPGPLTLVVPISQNSMAHELVTAGLNSIGLRCPMGFSRKVIKLFGKPLAAPSANRSGRISPTNAQHVADEFQQSDLLILDDGDCDVGLESTIIKVDGDRLILLRPGGITIEQIENASGAKIELVDEDAPIQAPGMMVSHYAPDAKVQLNSTCCEPDDAFLAFGSDEFSTCVASLNLSPSADLLEAASNLYGFMKKLDAKKPRRICVAPIPHSGIGIAINDRLQRAAAPKS